MFDFCQNIISCNLRSFQWKILSNKKKKLINKLIRDNIKYNKNKETINNYYKFKFHHYYFMAKKKIKLWC